MVRGPIYGFVDNTATHCLSRGSKGLIKQLCAERIFGQNQVFDKIIFYEEGVGHG